MARQFLRSRRIDSAACRFDVLAIESHAGKKPVVRLHKSAFGMAAEFATPTPLTPGHCATRENGTRFAITSLGP